MKTKKMIDMFDEKDIENSMSVFKEEENAYITETAGFVPLEVKLKQFEQNGYVAQFNDQEFTSKDYRELYLNPDFDITPEDDFEDVQEKLAALKVYQDEYMKTHSLGKYAKAGTDQPEQKTEIKETVSEEKTE